MRMEKLFSIEIQHEIFTKSKEYIAKGEFQIGEELLDMVIESASRNHDIISLVEAHLECLKIMLCS